MEDKFLKYSKLYILIFLLFLSVPMIIGLLVWAFYGMSKIVSSGPVDFIFQLLILTIPAAIYSTAYIIFLKRTRQHPVAVVRVVSTVLFIIGLACSGIILTADIILFLKKASYDIASYNSYSLGFMSGNIGGLFLIAIIQAFTGNKEKDWMDRKNENDNRT